MSPDRLGCYLFIVVALVGAVLIISLPGSDHLEGCVPPDPATPYFQPTGDRYATPVNQLVTPDSFVLPVNPTEDDLDTFLFSDSAFRYNTRRRVTNLLPAWLTFIGHDLYDFRVNTSEPFFGGYRAVHDHEHRVINYATPRLDGSQLYGVTEEIANSIRRLDGSGKLKTSTSPYPTTPDSLFMEYNNMTLTFVSADPRANDSPLVNALYQLFVREHNYWCDRLLAVNPEYSEDYLYEMAKHLVVAEMQAITYQEALPALLGTEFLPYCYVGSRHESRVYAEWAIGALPAVLATTFNETTLTRDPETNFLQPVAPYDVWLSGLGPILLGSSQQQADPRDPYFTPSTNDINRGRDALLPTYFRMYSKAFKGHLITKCHEYIAVDAVCDQLETLYTTADHTDLFTGILVEKEFHNSVLGRLGTWLFVHQFEELKNRDPYYFTSNPAIIKYRHKIMHTRFSQIILRQTTIRPSLLHPSVFQ